MATLVEKARSKALSRKSSTPITPEHIELAMAWAKGEVTTSQVAFALDRESESNAAYVMLARALAMNATS
jgi:hypothetical protein